MKRLLPLLLLIASTGAEAAKMIVIDARAAGLKPGMSIDSTAPLTLKEGERVTLIGPDGKTTVLRGKFSGQPAPKAGAAADPRQALAALINTRNSRSTALGAVRAGSEAAKLPDPWLIDISRPGARCLREGESPIWYRPDAAAAQSFTVYPVDRSWRADFAWQAGQDRLAAPPLSKFQGQTTFVVHADDQDRAVAMNIIPKGIDDELILASWMLEKGCLPQADALLARLQQTAAK